MVPQNANPSNLVRTRLETIYDPNLVKSDLIRRKRTNVSFWCVLAFSVHFICKRGVYSLTGLFSTTLLVRESINVAHLPLRSCFCVFFRILDHETEGSKTQILQIWCAQG